MGELTLDKNAIESLKEDKDSYVGKEGIRYYREPSRTHYFFTPSAFMLKKGDHKFSQLQLAVSEFAFGVSDNITLEFGTALPFWFLGAEAANFLYAFKAGGSPLDNLHIAGGIKGFIIPSFSGGIHLPFLTLTTGTPDRHASLSVSPVADGKFNFGELTWISLSGLYRMKRNSSLISENWIMLGDKNLTLISGMGIRIFGKRFSADVGGFFFLSDGIGMPLPWLTFSWSIGKGR